jgi:endonuclease YncB( thermonuclease family)
MFKRKAFRFRSDLRRRTGQPWHIYSERLIEIREWHAILLISATAIIIITVFAWSYFHHRQLNIIAIPHSTKLAQPAQTKAVSTDDTKTIDFNNWTTSNDAYQYYQFQLTSNGSLRADKQSFHLYGIILPKRNQVCIYHDGERWACGLRAHVALLNFIGSTALGCRPENDSKPTILICRLVDTDVSEWMLANGWAYLEQGVTERPYINAAAVGFYFKAGVWAEQPH